LSHVIAWLSVGRSKSDRAGRSAAQQVLLEYSKGVNHRQQLQDMCRIVLLRQSQLAALVRHWVLVPLVVLLRQDRRHCDVACIRRQHRAAGRVEGA
jgi:hypothetical protein